MRPLEHLAVRAPDDRRDVAGPGPASRALTLPRARPAHVAAAVVFAGAAWLKTSPISDLDSYWHVEIGRQIVSGHTVDGLGRAWLGVPASSWRTSQWLSEVGMFEAVDHLGWTGLVALRLIATAVLFTVLALTLIRRRQPIAGLLVVVLVVVGLEILLQERPATFTLAFLALLGPACERLWRTGRYPPPLAVALLSVLWAQMHGTWVLAPCAFALVGLGALLDRRAAPRGQLRGAIVCTAASTAGVVNPQGFVSFLLPLRFQGAGQGRINEWFPTTFTTSLSISWGILVLLLIYAWVRSPVHVGRTELLWCTVWTAFALSAVRNVGPVLLLMAPVALTALERSFRTRLDRVSAHPPPSLARVLAATIASVLLVAVAAITAALIRLDPLRETPALAIARHLAVVPGPVRVYNDYNTSGSLIAFAGGGRGQVQLAVDGRADLWGRQYIDRLMNVQNIQPGWERDLRAFRPDAVVMPSDAPVVTSLVASGSWRVAMTDQHYVLLVPDSPTLVG